MSVTQTASPVTPVDFADVYADNLDKVWRFVRARVRDHHDAHDVTSDVFVRAWRSWDRFDPAKGPVEPWLFTIAYRTIADRLRRRGVEEPVEPEQLTWAGGASPEHEILRDELLAQLAQALEGLSQRERDGLALRFAARLSMQHVADVLGTSVGAAKMMIHRTIRGLASEVAAATVPPEQGAADLEAVIDDVLARGHDSMDDSELHGLLVHLAAVHEEPTPDGLSNHVAHCIQCAVEEDLDDDRRSGDRAGDPAGAPGRSRLAGYGAMLLPFMGVCLVCTVPALQTLFVAIGVGAASYAIHLVGLAAVPVVLWLVWRGTRRHGCDRGFRWARAGAVAMAVHAVIHAVMEVVPGTAVAVWVEIPVMLTFVATDWAGTGLLVLGAGLNLVDMHRWRRSQAAGMRALLAST